MQETCCAGKLALCVSEAHFNASHLVERLLCGLLPCKLVPLMATHMQSAACPPAGLPPL